MLFAGFDQFEELKGFRGTYKAGPVLMLGLAGLVGIGAAAIARRVRGRGRTIVAVSVAIVLLGAVSYPFWTDSLYRRQENLAAIPDYYRDATSWLDRQPGEGRVLVLPSTVEAVYRWGAAGDDIIDSLLDRPHIVRAQIDEQMGTAESANLLAAVDDYLGNGEYKPGALAPIARRLGIRYVMLRNDIDWNATRRPDPSSFETLRRDPELHQVASFGPVVPNVDPLGGVTHRPQVQIYEIDGAGPLARTTSGPALLVSGDGAAWPEIARSGMLTNGGPVRYTGDASVRDLKRELRNGAAVVETDTNLRHVFTVPGATDVPVPSRALRADEGVAHRDVPDLFEKPGTQALAYSPDASRVSASSYGGRIGIPRPDSRPENAFDQNPETSWYVGGFDEDPSGEWIQVDFNESQSLDRMRIVRAKRQPGQRFVSQAVASFSDGTSVPIELTDETTDVQFRRRTTDFVRLTIRTVMEHGDEPVGIAEIGFPGLDLREHLQLPTDLDRAAAADPEFAALLARAPHTFQFVRLGPLVPGGSQVEVDLRRRFKTAAPAEYRVEGSVRGPVSASSDCREDVILLDGHPVPIRVDAAPQTGDAANPRSQTFPFEGCSTVTLDAGWHILESVPGTTVDDVRLSTGPPQPEARSAPLETTEREQGSVTVPVDAERDSRVILGESYDENWRARSGANDLGAPIALDTQSAWSVPDSGRSILEAEFAPERTYTIALVITGAGVVLCLVLAVRPRRRRSADSRPSPSEPQV
jgi:hypothetical protein